MAAMPGQARHDKRWGVGSAPLARIRRPSNSVTPATSRGRGRSAFHISPDRNSARNTAVAQTGFGSVDKVC